MKKRLGEFWVVFDCPKNYPGSYVARMFHDSEPVEDCIMISPRIDLLREFLESKNLVCLPPDFDDATVLEIWAKRGDSMN